MKPKRLWKSFCIVFTTLFILLFSLPVQAAPPPRDEVMHLLEGYEWTIVPEKFKNLEDVDLTLMEIVKDPKPMLNYYRLRALEVLRLFPKPRVADFLDVYLSQEKGTSRLRRALDSFSINFASTQPERVQKVAARFLKHPKPNIRIAAISTLRKIGTPEALRLLNTHLEKETKPWILQRMK